MRFCAVDCVDALVVTSLRPLVALAIVVVGGSLWRSFVVLLSVPLLSLVVVRLLHWLGSYLWPFLDFVVVVVVVVVAVLSLSSWRLFPSPLSF